jgi:hypothetical protein
VVAEHLAAAQQAPQGGVCRQRPRPQPEPQLQQALTQDPPGVETETAADSCQRRL